ncbi:MAG: hypothetical protein FJX77_11980, partial [Armatimonadetes bacterium]|nr:hypothetical protein [Armatimonadota bacterium]
MNRRQFLIGPVAAVPALAGSASGQASRPNLAAGGEPLGTALPRLGQQLNAQLSADRVLQSQRVTLFLPDADGAMLTHGLEELLSPTETARVVWAKQGNETWRLQENANRRKLRADLQDTDLAALRRHLRLEMERFQQVGREEFASGKRVPEPGVRSLGSPTRDPEEERRREKRAIAERALVPAVLLDAGERGLERLMGGEPLVVRAGQLRSPAREIMAEYLRGVSRGTLPDDVSDYYIGFILSRSPHDPLGAQLYQSLIRPDGRRWSRSSLVNVPRPAGLPVSYAGLGELRFSPPDPHVRGKRVSFRLAQGERQVPPETLVEVRLDDLLLAMARESKTPVLADGYLRFSVRVPANTWLRDYPLHQFLDRIAEVWGCAWQYLHGAPQGDHREPRDNQDVVLVRSRGWWMEDEADVPEAQVRRFQAAFPPDRVPDLDALIELAALKTPQLHKVIEAGHCPGATGLVRVGWGDGTGLAPCLRLLGSLPRALRARAESEAGLPLRDVSPELVRQHLGVTLAVEVGAVTPELQRDLVF